VEVSRGSRHGLHALFVEARVGVRLSSGGGLVGGGGGGGSFGFNGN
jgi:hypothetical protein